MPTPVSLPYYQMYPKDFDADERVRLMNDAQVGLYVRLLNYSWINNGLPVDPDKIRLIMPGVSWAGFDENWSVIEPCFPRTRDNRRRNKRQEKEREKADRTSKVNRANALSVSDRSAKTPDGGSGFAPRHARASESDIRYQISEPESGKVISLANASSPQTAPAVRGLGRESMFERFWENVWAKIGKGAAKKVWMRKITTRDLGEQVIAAAKQQGPGLIRHAADNGHSILHPATWLNAERWTDEPEPRRKTAIELAMDMMEEA